MPCLRGVFVWFWWLVSLCVFYGVYIGVDLLFLCGFFKVSHFLGEIWHLYFERFLLYKGFLSLWHFYAKWRILLQWCFWKEPPMKFGKNFLGHVKPRRWHEKCICGTFRAMKGLESTVYFYYIFFIGGVFIIGGGKIKMSYMPHLLVVFVYSVWSF